MHKQIPDTIDHDSFCDRKSCQEFALIGVECRPLQGPGHAGQIAKAGVSNDGSGMSGPMIVVPTNHFRFIVDNPLNAFCRIRAVIHQIAQTEADIEFLADRFQSDRIRVYVRNDKDPHQVKTLEMAKKGNISSGD